MSDLMEPTAVHRPRPSATWTVDQFDVRRHVDPIKGETVSFGHRGGALRLLATPAVAVQLGEAITAAAEWTDDDVVNAEIVDDRPRIERSTLTLALDAVRPSWMTERAARDLSGELVEYLHHCTGIVIVQDGEEWTP